MQCEIFQDEPSPESQEGQILALLREGEITPLDMVKEGIYQYNARLHELRKRGYNITCTILKFKNRFGKPAKVGQYRLEE